MKSRLGGRGQAMVEFALVAPLIFLLLLGIVDFGRALFYANELTNAAREGARAAILQSNKCNTSFGTSANCPAGALGSGTTVCQAIENEATLVGGWKGCPVPPNQTADPDATGGLSQLPTGNASSGAGCNPCQDTAYIAIVQASASSTDCSSFTKDNTTPSTPRGVTGQALPVQVVIHYYYVPLTGLLSQFFPQNFHLSTSACARPEY